MDKELISTVGNDIYEFVVEAVSEKHQDGSFEANPFEIYTSILLGAWHAAHACIENCPEASKSDLQHDLAMKTIRIGESLLKKDFE